MTTLLTLHFLEAQTQVGLVKIRIRIITLKIIINFDQVKGQLGIKLETLKVA